MYPLVCVPIQLSNCPNTRPPACKNQFFSNLFNDQPWPAFLLHSFGGGIRPYSSWQPWWRAMSHHGNEPWATMATINPQLNQPTLEPLNVPPNLLVALVDNLEAVWNTFGNKTKWWYKRSIWFSPRRKICCWNKLAQLWSQVKNPCPPCPLPAVGS